MSKTIDQLNFQVVLDDREFDAKVKADIALAKELNTQLSNLLQAKINITKVSPQDAASAKRTSDILTKQATDQEKINQAKAKTAEAEEKIATQAAKTAKELERAGVASSQSYLNMKRAGTEAQRTATEMQRTATAAQNTANATARAQLAQQRLANFSRATTTEYQTQSRLVSELKNYALGYLSISGVSKLLSSLVRVTGEFELQKTTLAAMIGDLNKAEGIITRIQGLAVESPFQFKELTTYAKQLSAFSVPAQELYDTTKMLADISAGLGVGMDRIVLAYGQVRSAAFLRGQEVRQFTEAGIPILDELAKQFSELNGRAVTTAEVFDLISKRMVPFEMVAKIFKQMTSEGGKFYKMQEVQAETLKGKISNLKDAYEVMLNEIGKGQSENLKGAVDWARRLMTNYEDTGKALVELIATYGIYKTTLIGLEVVTNTFVASNHKLIASLISAGKYLVTNPYMVVAAGITAVGYAIYKNHTALEGFQKVQKSVASIQSDFTKDLSKESAKLDSLYSKLKLAKKGTQEYEEAKKSIYSQYAGYISELKAEGIEVSNLADIYGLLKEKIEGSVKVRTSAKAKQRLNETYDQEVDEYYDKYLKIITKAQKELNRRSKNGYADFNEFEKAGFWKFITGSMNIGDLERTSGLERVVRVLNNASLDAATDLRDLRKAMMMTTREYESSLKKIKAAYGDLEENTGGNIMPTVTTTGGDNQAAIDAIKKQIQALQTLKKEYDDWKELGVSDESLQLSLQGFFPNIKQEFGENFITDLNFATRILEKIKQLEAIAPDEAYNLKMSFGLEKSAEGKDAAKKQIKAYEDVAEAANKYFETLRKWRDEDFDLEGKGITFDLSKIISDLNEKLNEIDTKASGVRELFSKINLKSEEDIAKVKEIFVKEFGADAWKEFWTSYKEEGEQAIQDLYDAQVKYETKIAQDKIRSLAKGFAKEQLGDLSLNDWGDKSLAQIKSIQKKLSGLITADIVFPPELEERANKLGLSLEELYTLVKEVFSGEYNEVIVEKFKKIQDKAKETVSIFGTVGESLSNFGGALGLDGLEDVGKYLDAIEDVATALVECDALWESLSNSQKEVSDGADEVGESIDNIAASSDWITVIIKVILTLIGQVTTAVQAEAEGWEAAQKAAISYREVLYDIAKTNADSVFGLNWSEKLKADLENAEWALGTYQNKLNSMLRKDLGGVKQRTFNINENQWSWYVIKDLQGLIDFYDLADEMGNIDMDWISAHLDALIDSTAYNGKKLKKSLEKDLELLVSFYQEYQEAYKQIKATISEILSDTATDYANTIVDSFLSVGDAVADLEKVFEGLGETILKTFIQDKLITDVLDNYVDSISKLFTDKSAGLINEGEFAFKLGEIASLINKDITELGPSLNALAQAFQDAGLLAQESLESVSVASGIKGVTEDTANLLASYINAIRADVSLGREQWISMNNHLQQIVSLLSQQNLPSLAVYQAQIAANTYDTAVATQSILSRLDSVITSEGGLEAIRTYS